jgi:ribonuclease P protein component
LSQSFPRERRLLCPADFRRVFNEPSKSSDALFTVLARAHPSHGQLSRLGLAIAKKQLRRAVDRNRVKRLTREYFRLQVPSGCGLDFVVMVRAVARQRTNRELRDSLHTHFQHLLARQPRPKA